MYEEPNTRKIEQSILAAINASEDADATAIIACIARWFVRRADTPTLHAYDELMSSGPVESFEQIRAEGRR